MRKFTALADQLVRRLRQVAIQPLSVGIAATERPGLKSQLR
jgi:hypothetical protein